MSIASDLKIELLPSANYRRIAWLLTGWALMGLYAVHAAWWLALGLSASMGCALWRVTRYPFPRANLRTIAYHHTQWVLGFTDKQECYDHTVIVADSGLFIVLRCSNDCRRSKRILVLFYDQLSEFELRTLNRLVRVTKPSPIQTPKSHDSMLL